MPHRSVEERFRDDLNDPISAFGLIIVIPIIAMIVSKWYGISIKDLLQETEGIGSQLYAERYGLV